MKGWKGHRAAEKKRAIAMHEAAHAVAYLVLRGNLSGVSIRPIILVNGVEVALEQHPLKAWFTTESTGTAISALLRQGALQRAGASVPPTGGAK